MMFAALLVVAQMAKTDIEIVPPIRSGVITVEALMRLPKSGPRERAELAILAETLLDDTQEYGHRQLVKLSVMSGDTVRCDLYPDCLRVRFGVIEPDEASVIPMLANIVHGSEFQDEAITDAVSSLMFRRRDYWASALEPEALKFREASIPDLRTLYKVIGRPENLTITIAAPDSIGADLLSKWNSTVSDWNLGRNPMFPPDSASLKPNFQRRGKLTTILLRGRPINPKGADFASNLLAIFALGGGKDSAVWKALREGLGWSYRQEALLRNSPDGLEPAIEVVTSHSQSDIERASLVRPASRRWYPRGRKLTRHMRLLPPTPCSTATSDSTLFTSRASEPRATTRCSCKHTGDSRPARSGSRNSLLAAMANVDVKTMQAAATAILEKFQASNLFAELGRFFLGLWVMGQ